MSTTKRKAANKKMSELNKRFGAGALSFLSDVIDDYTVKFHKTPSHEVNAMLDGGIAKGRIIELYGNESTGKTSFALEVVGKEMREDPEFTVAWVETEGSLDPEYIKMFGIDLNRFIVIEQSDQLVAEDCMDIIRGLVSETNIDMVVLNSVAALSCKTEIEDDMDKQQMALLARLLSKFLKITTGMLKKNNTTLVLINQVRQNIGGNTKYIVNVTSGGKAIRFYATQRVEFKKEQIKAGEAIAPEDGVKITCRTIKNRIAKGNPYKTCSYYAVYGKGIDPVLELGTVLVREGIINRAGAWMKYEDSEGNVIKRDFGDGEIECKWNGNAAFTNFIRENANARKYFEDILNEYLKEGRLKGRSVSKEDIDKLKAIEENDDKDMEDIDVEVEDLESIDKDMEV